MTQLRHGPEVLPDGARFSLWAPHLERVLVRVGEREHELEGRGDGWWSAHVPGVKAGDRYVHVLPDGRALPDPASRRQPDGGGPDALQRFVDAAHGLGLTVCLDVVYNHLGPEGNLTVNLGPEPAGGLPGWGWAIREGGG